MTEQPNIVLVTIDSLRADHCGCYGYERDTTPTLDRMAEEGTMFENAIAPGPSTPESMPAIFTGMYPVGGTEELGNEGGVDSWREQIRTHMQTRETHAERFQRQGYETAAFTPNPFTSRYFGFDEGFDHFQDFMDESNRGSLYKRVFDGFLEGSGAASMARVLMNFWQREEVFKPWESYYDEIVEWTDQAEEPYFLWVFLMDAHNPYMAPREYRTQSRWAQFHANFEFWRQSHETPFSETVHDRLVTAYDDAVRYSDAFLDRLQRDVVTDDTVVAVHGDHGEAFGEHGSYGHEPYLYEENVHVPLVVSNVTPRTISEPTTLSDMEAIHHAVIDGADGSDSGLETRTAVRSRTVQGNRDGVRGRAWKLIRNKPADSALWTELYELSGGETETLDDSGLEETANQLLSRLDESLAEQRRVLESTAQLEQA